MRTSSTASLRLVGATLVATVLAAPAPAWSAEPIAPAPGAPVLAPGAPAFAEVGPVTAAPEPKPPRTPEQQWKRRRGILIANLTASAFIVAVGLSLSTVPWIAGAACARRNPNEECGEGLGAVYMTAVGAPLVVAGGIPLAVWSVRLHRHRQHRPVVATFAGAGLRLAF